MDFFLAKVFKVRGMRHEVSSDAKKAKIYRFQSHNPLFRYEPRLKLSAPYANCQHHGPTFAPFCICLPLVEAEKRSKCFWALPCFEISSHLVKLFFNKGVSCGHEGSNKSSKAQNCDKKIYFFGQNN